MNRFEKAKVEWKQWCDEHSEFVPLEDYKGASHPIAIKHTKCGNVAKQRPADLKYGHGCKKCAIEKNRGNTNWMNRQTNPIRYVNREDLEKILGDEYEILSPCKEFRSTERIEIKHKLCDTKTLRTPYEIERGKYCGKSLCYNGKSDKDFKQELSALTNSIIPLETYRGGSQKILCECKACGLKWEVVADSLLSGHGCPKCYRKQQTMTNDEFLARVNEFEDSNEYEFLSPYIKNQEKIKIKHLKCGNEYEATPWHFLHGRRCPKCAWANVNVSDKEKDVRSFVEECGVYAIYNTREIIPPLELDIYIPDKKVAIEFNGTYWHGDEQKPTDYHYIKSKMCEEKGIRLIHVFEYEWDNPRQRPILENIIKHALGITEKVIYARKCKIEERKSASMREFFETNNIQGFRGGQRAICLVYEGRVVMSYIVGKCFFAKKPAYEIIRGATELGYTVVGGASKLWTYIINKWNNLPILYYIDYNYFDGSSIGSLEGLKFIKITPSFKNWWKVYWKTGERNVIKNREPLHHKQVIEAQKKGLGWQIYNAGIKTYIYEPKNIKKT